MKRLNDNQNKMIRQICTNGVIVWGGRLNVDTSVFDHFDWQRRLPV